MKHQVVITILIILAVFVLLVIFLHPEWIANAWLWAIGLIGSVGAFFKRIYQKFTGNKIKEVDTSNDDIKNRINDLDIQIQQTNERHELEKKLYQKDIELLNQKILLKEKEIDLERQKRTMIEQMSWQEYYNSLPESEKEKIEQDKNSHTIDAN